MKMIVALSVDVSMGRIRVSTSSFPVYRWSEHQHRSKRSLSSQNGQKSTVPQGDRFRSHKKSPQRSRNIPPGILCRKGEGGFSCTKKRIRGNRKRSSTISLWVERAS